MRFTHAAHLFYDALLTLAYPQACRICGHSVEQRKHGVACDACWKATKIFTGRETFCWKCGAVCSAGDSPDPREPVRCRRCDSQLIAAARATGLYEGALRESVLLLKRQPHLSDHLAALLVAAGKRQPLSACTRIIPVPLHAERFRERGFNQASVIARVLSRPLEAPVDEFSLRRVTSSEKYRAGLDARGRRDTVAGAFKVRHRQLIANEEILLVDDVFTTGATVGSCAEALLAAGARSVFVLTIARTGGPGRLPKDSAD